MRAIEKETNLSSTQVSLRMQPMNRRFQADLSLAFCAFLWGATYVCIKGALSSASVFVFLFMRCTLAAVAVALIYRITVRSLDRRSMAAGTVLGTLMFAGYAMQTVGLRLTTPSKAAFITGSSVVMVPLFHAWIGRHRVSPWVWTGVLVAFTGIYFLTVPAAGLSALNKGDLWMLGCAVFLALHIIAVGHYTPRHSVGVLSFTQVAVTAVFSAMFLPLLWATHLEIPRLVWSRVLVIGVVFAAIGATAIGYSLQVWAQRFAAPAHVAILFSLRPIFAALTSFAVYGERLTTRALGGGVLVLTGILLAELMDRGPDTITETTAAHALSPAK